MSQSDKHIHNYKTLRNFAPMVRFFKKLLKLVIVHELLLFSEYCVSIT